MAWDMRYRPLKEGEIILTTDEVQEDDGSWRVGCRCAGQPAPDPNYTSHRVYRRLSRPNERSATYNRHLLSDLAMSESYHPGDDA
jgi:hypothetical protein